MNLLDGVLLPKSISVCKCEAHTRDTDPVSQADLAAKQTAQRAHALPILK